MSETTPTTVKHTGEQKEGFTFTFDLDEPIDYTEPQSSWRKTLPTIWRYHQITIRFTRSKSGPADDWSDWRVRFDGKANNVLKSGEIGNRTPSQYSDHLLAGSLYDSRHELADWCKDVVQPLLDEARARRDADAWNGAW